MSQILGSQRPRSTVCIHSPSIKERMTAVVASIPPMMINALVTDEWGRYNDTILGGWLISHLHPGERDFLSFHFLECDACQDAFVEALKDWVWHAQDHSETGYSDETKCKSMKVLIAAANGVLGHEGQLDVLKHLHVCKGVCLWIVPRLQDAITIHVTGGLSDIVE